MERNIEDGGGINSMPKICILTPIANYHDKWLVPQADYRCLLGEDVAFRSWTNAGDLSGFALILPLIAWGYQRDCPAWFSLLDQMETLPVANPTNVLRWNSDKTYLIELEAEGVAIVPTIMRESLTQAALNDAREIFGTGRVVVKPPISGGADGTYLIGASDALPVGAIGKRMLIQPFLPAVSGEGEFSLFYFGGRYSHAISKHPAKGDFRVQEQFGGRERAVAAPAEALVLAETTLLVTQRIMDCAPLTYARVDMLRDDKGAMRLMELELIEPSLFLGFAADKGAMFAGAVNAKIAAF
jgi:hypothetical protein